MGYLSVLSHAILSLSRLRPCTVVFCPVSSLIFFVYSAHPPSLFSPLHLSLCIIFLLMLPCCCCCVLVDRETNIDCTRCFRCSNLGHWARDCATLWTSQGNVHRGTGFAPGYSYSFQRKVAEPKCSLVQSSEVFDEDINEIAQVRCENKVLEFELCNRSPSANVKGNLQRNLAFWKRIETPRFILNVIDRRYFLPFLNLAEPAAFANNRSSLIHADFCRVSDRRASRFGSCR